MTEIALTSCGCDAALDDIDAIFRHRFDTVLRTCHLPEDAPARTPRRLHPVLAGPAAVGVSGFAML